MNSKDEKKIIEKTVAALERQTGLRVEDCRPTDKGGIRADYKFALIAPRENKTHLFLAEVKKRLNNAIIGEAAFRFRSAEEKLVLVTEYVSQPQAEKLRSLDISFFDAAGNAYFNEAGLYVFVSGQRKRREDDREKLPRLFRPPGMKLLFAFLTNPGLENESYRSISVATGVPTATVGVFMKDLENTGYLARRAKNRRSLTRREELFKRFVENYGESFRPTLEPVRFRSKKYEGRWWENVDLKKFKAFWGGETGAAKLTEHLKPQIATVYADSLLPRFQAEYALVRDNKGDVEILKKFWTGGETKNAVAPPLVVYADLIATADERNLETAEIIYERYLADTAKADS